MHARSTRRPYRPRRCERRDVIATADEVYRDRSLRWIMQYALLDFAARSAFNRIAFELDPQVHELTTRNIAGLDREIALTHGDGPTYSSPLDTFSTTI